MLRNILSYLLILCSFIVSAQETQWPKETVFYQIYMPSFQDSDGNGLSDFAGMTARLDYLHELGIKGIWLTPFLKSPRVDNGYDVASYYEIDTTYGNLEELKTFLDEAHQRGIKVIMDMVVNHTSTDAEWFKESQKSRDNPYRDYYIWRDEPNNWESFFGGSAWAFDSVTHQYYYHKFDTRMADLNWSNPTVAGEINQVVRYWLDLGMDGFRFDVINFLLTDGITRDNPMKDGVQEHLYDVDQPGVKAAMSGIKSRVNEYEDRFVVGEVGSDNIEILRQYQSPDLMDVVFNFNFGSIPEFSVERIFAELKSMEENMPGYPTLFFGSHDMPRLMDRLADGDPQRAKALATLMLTAKGIPFIYYGEEIGMRNITANSYDEIVDIQGKTQYMLALKQGKTPAEALAAGNAHNRDKSRSPMQWNSSHAAGFTSGTPWIKINENYKYTNVEESLHSENSMLNMYKLLISLRNQEKVLQYGEYENLLMQQDRIEFTRIFQNEKVTVVVNFGEDTNISIPPDAHILIGGNELKTNDFLIYRH
ncbi:MAG TPA: glucohydrolase [Bacteroidales bacterium]|nr:glucohydrolase [Bacteroidales bacterium]